MSARAIVYPGSFGDTTLPRIGLTYAQPLAGAIYDWAVDGLTAGPLAEWTSSVDGKALTPTAGVPMVVGAGPDAVVKLNGTTDRIQGTFTKAGAHTVVAVYRYTSPLGSDTIHYGLSSAGAGTVANNGSLNAIRASADGAFINPSPAIVPNTLWHVSILSINGANTVFRHDDQETLGTFPSVTRDGITLGFGIGNLRTAIEFKRVAILDGTTTPFQRNQIVAQMKQQYGI